MKREHSIHAGNTNKPVSQCSPSIHTTLLTLYRREDNTYYWQHCRKEAEDDLFVDVDGLQLDLFGDPILHKDWILEAIL